MTDPELRAKGDRNGSNGRQVRYGVAGLGWFAQAAILPAFRNARKSARLAALFSSDPEKLRRLGDEYGVQVRFLLRPARERDPRRGARRPLHRAPQPPPPRLHRARRRGRRPRAVREADGGDRGGVARR